MTTHALAALLRRAHVRTVLATLVLLYLVVLMGYAVSLRAAVILAISLVVAVAAVSALRRASRQVDTIFEEELDDPRKDVS
jgi:hypothetical protein